MKKAFTMIELVFTIVILGILSSVAIPHLVATRDDAAVASGVQRVTKMLTSIGTYYTMQGFFDSDLSKMTFVRLMDSNNQPFEGDFIATSTYFGNETFTRRCIKVVADDSQGTITLTPASDGSAYCDALIKALGKTVGVHTFGGSHLYK